MKTRLNINYARKNLIHSTRAVRTILSLMVILTTMLFNHSLHAAANCASADGTNIPADGNYHPNPPKKAEKEPEDTTSATITTTTSYPVPNNPGMTYVVTIENWSVASYKWSAAIASASTETSNPLEIDTSASVTWQTSFGFSNNLTISYGCQTTSTMNVKRTFELPEGLGMLAEVYQLIAYSTDYTKTSSIYGSSTSSSAGGGGGTVKTTDGLAYKCKES